MLITVADCRCRFGDETMSRLSLHRTGSSSYREYLRSPQWGFRRVRWFRDQRKRGFEPACQVCGITLTDAETLDLHHVSYEGVGRDSSTGQWRAQETDEDLMSLCRQHHRDLHRIMDGRKEFFGWDRRRATVVIIARMIRRHRRRT